MNTSLPEPPSNVSLPRPPVMVSLPDPPINRSLPSPPSNTSLPPPPSMVSLPAPPSMKSAVFDGLAPPVAATVDETKDGVMISSAPVPMKLAMLVILTIVLRAKA